MGNYSIKEISGCAFLSFPGMKELLFSECSGRFRKDISSSEQYEDLVYVPDCVSDGVMPYWSKCTMLKPLLITFESVSDAANALKSIQRSWAPYSYTLFRRSSLIQDKLPYVNLKNRDFPFDIPKSPIGLYTLIDEHTMIASALTDSNLPAGTITWNEDHTNPPSRAYLKIQESLTLAHHFFGVEMPGVGSRCFEAGACPGGWTWVLANLGARVFAVDRSPLADSLMKNPLVTFQAHDAFTFKPDELGEFDWIFSDVICYPERLYDWVCMWLESKKVRNMICTIKMQGEINWPLVEKFASIPDSRVVHLNYNKHELTFIHCSSSSDKKES